MRLACSALLHAFLLCLVLFHPMMCHLFSLGLLCPTLSCFALFYFTVPLFYFHLPLLTHLFVVYLVLTCLDLLFPTLPCPVLFCSISLCSGLVLLSRSLPCSTLLYPVRFSLSNSSSLNFARSYYTILCPILHCLAFIYHSVLLFPAQLNIDLLSLALF